MIHEVYTLSGPEGDATTTAINEVTRTMGGDDENGSAAAVLPPEHHSKIVEDELVETGGVFVQRSKVQRQVLGCLACRLGIIPQAELEISDLAICLSKEAKTVARILHKLRDGDILASRETIVGRGRPPVLYRFAATPQGRRAQYMLQPPASCGLEEIRPNPPNATAEGGVQR